MATVPHEPQAIYAGARCCPVVLHGTHASPDHVVIDIHDPPAPASNERSDASSACSSTETPSSSSSSVSSATSSSSSQVSSASMELSSSQASSPRTTSPISGDGSAGASVTGAVAPDASHLQHQVVTVPFFPSPVARKRLLLQKADLQHVGAKHLPQHLVPSNSAPLLETKRVRFMHMQPMHTVSLKQRQRHPTLLEQYRRQTRTHTPATPSSAEPPAMKTHGRLALAAGSLARRHSSASDDIAGNYDDESDENNSDDEHGGGDSDNESDDVDDDDTSEDHGIDSESDSYVHSAQVSVTALGRRRKVTNAKPARRRHVDGNDGEALRHTHYPCNVKQCATTSRDRVTAAMHAPSPTSRPFTSPYMQAGARPEVDTQPLQHPNAHLSGTASNSAMHIPTTTSSGTSAMEGAPGAASASSAASAGAVASTPRQPNNGWDDAATRQAHAWLHVAQLSCTMNELAAIDNTRYHRIGMAFSAALMGLVSASGIAQLSQNAGEWVSYVSSICAILLTIVTGVLTNMEWKAKSAALSKRSLGYSTLATMLRVQLVLHPEARVPTHELFESIPKRVEQLDELAEPLPLKYRARAERSSGMLSLWGMSQSSLPQSSYHGGDARGSRGRLPAVRVHASRAGRPFTVEARNGDGSGTHSPSHISLRQSRPVRRATPAVRQRSGSAPPVLSLSPGSSNAATSTDSGGALAESVTPPASSAESTTDVQSTAELSSDTSTSQ